MREKPFVSKLNVLIYIFNARSPITYFDLMEDVTDLSKGAVVCILRSLIESGLVKTEKKGRQYFYSPTDYAKELFNRA